MYFSSHWPGCGVAELSPDLAQKCQGDQEGEGKHHPIPKREVTAIRIIAGHYVTLLEARSILNEFSFRLVNETSYGPLAWLPVRACVELVILDADQRPFGD